MLNLLPDSVIDRINEFYCNYVSIYDKDVRIGVFHIDDDLCYNLDFRHNDFDYTKYKKYNKLLCSIIEKHLLRRDVDMGLFRIIDSNNVYGKYFNHAASINHVIAVFKKKSTIKEDEKSNILQVFNVSIKDKKILMCIMSLLSK